MSVCPPKALLGKYSGRNLAVNDLQQLTKALSVYYRKQGYPVATAFLPRQDIVAGIVTIKVFPGVLDKLRVKNSTSLEDRFVEGFLKNLYAGMQLRSDILEMTLNNLNALPGVQAKGILEPGDKIGSSSLTIVLGVSWKALFILTIMAVNIRDVTVTECRSLLMSRCAAGTGLLLAGFLVMRR